MAEDIPQWLNRLGLGQYAQAFVDNGIGVEALPYLRDEDFERLGVLLGHMRRLQAAIETLSADEPPTRPVPPPSKEPEPRPAEAERRQLTVMFCDLVGSTALSGALDPEDYREVMRAYQEAGVAVVRRYDGYVARYLGDGLLVYFGYPQAHEDDAERAVRAGLAMAEAIGALTLRPDLRLQVRIGIATGLVVVGDMVGAGVFEERAVSGDTPNLAARLQALAEADSVVISASTRQLLGELFEYRDLGARRMKGIVEPVQAWRVVGERISGSRFEAVRAQSLTPFVGREQEIALLLDRWERVTEGDGQVVLLSGEAGIGKSRITQILNERLADEPHTRLRYQCSPFHANSALFPIISQLEHAARFAPDDSSQKKLDKLETLLGQSTEDVQEVASLFAALLSIPTSDRYPPLDMTPQRQKQKTLETLVDQFVGLAARQPVLLVLEDAHWIDPTTQELIELTVNRIQESRMLAVITFRPEFTPPWSGHTHVTSLTLTRLGRRQSVTMMEKVTGGKAIPAEMLDQIVAKTDGVPLFVEELTKTVLESGLIRDKGDAYELAGALPPLAIPASLQDSLMARLDRLAFAKDVAQLGAVIGREFSYNLVNEVSALSEDKLADAFNRLTQSQVVFQRGLPPEASYVFKHALIQDAAYQSLLRGTRQEYHLSIARALEQHAPETVDNRPELLAHHFTEAQRANEAATYWYFAAQRAIARSAHVEAINHVSKGLDTLQSLDNTPERAQLELDLQTTYGTALRVTRGYAAPEVVHVYERARKLCMELGEPPQFFPVLWGLMLSQFVRGEVKTAHDLAEQLFNLSQRKQDSDLILEAHIALGMTLLQLGKVTAAREQLENGLVLYNPRKHHAHALVYGQDPGVFCLSYDAWALWFLGYPDQAVERINEALTVARQVGHIYSRVFALTFGARIHQCRGDELEVEKMAEETISTSREHGFAYYLAQGIMQRGWALTRQGKVDEGIAQLHEGLSALQATRAELSRPGSLIQLAEVYANAGLNGEALAALSEASHLVDQKGTRFWDAEMCRLKGLFLLALSKDNQAEAEGCFRHALEIARHQQAKFFELRAAVNLSRLLQRKNKQSEARTVLAGIYGWFTEGYETVDLQEARAMLGKLQ